MLVMRIEFVVVGYELVVLLLSEIGIIIKVYNCIKYFSKYFNN